MIATHTQESLPIRKRKRKIMGRRNYPLKTRRKCNPILWAPLYLLRVYYIVLQRIYGKAPVGRAASVRIDASVDREAVPPLSPSSRTSASAAIISGKQPG